MTLIEKEDLYKLWNRIENGGLLRVVPEVGNENRERGSPMSDMQENWWMLRRLEENIQDVGPIITILELGVADGGGSKIWEQVLLSQIKYQIKYEYGIYGIKEADLLYIGVDYGPNILWNWKKSPVDMRIITGDTHKDETRNKVKQILMEKGKKNGKIREVDFLFIDAQHWSVDVEKDLIDYGGFVGTNRIIGFHDTRLCRSFWDRFTGAGIDATDRVEDEIGFKNEKAVFHKEEMKYSLGTGLFWKTPDQTVVKFRDI